MLLILEIKISLVSIKKSSIRVTHPIRGRSVHSIFLKKISLLTNIRSKCVIKKINLFFDVMKNAQVFPSKLCHFQYDHRLLLNREMEKVQGGTSAKTYSI